MGLTGARKGSIKVNGTETIHMPTHRIAHQGIGYCPEERGIFASLSCEENLLLLPALKGAGPGMSIDEIYAMFPNLAERRHSQGTRLSGGEQQMLAVGRILRTGAKLLLLDEIAGGLTEPEAKQLVEELQQIKARGVTMIWIEHVVHALLSLADRLFVINFGQQLAEGEPHAVMNDPEVRRVYMGMEA